MAHVRNYESSGSGRRLLRLAPGIRLGGDAESAEATLLVSGGAQTAAAPLYAVEADSLEQNRVAPAAGDSVNTRTLVSCGWPWDTQRIAIVDSESFRRCPDGQVGEIWVAGPSVAGGYWNQPEKTAVTFAAQTANGAGPFLRTGDLGFLWQGELSERGHQDNLVFSVGRILPYYTPGIAVLDGLQRALLQDA